MSYWLRRRTPTTYLSGVTTQNVVGREYSPTRPNPTQIANGDFRRNR